MSAGSAEPVNNCEHEEECEITTVSDPTEVWLCIDCGNLRLEEHGHVCLDYNCCTDM